jgi:hypothetical protein
VGALLVVLALGLCQPASAQTTGSIRGTAEDNGGQPIPGVSVILTGDPLPGSQRSAVTSGTGVFHLGSLPVGSYSLTATLSGFKDQTVDDVRVSIGGTASVSFILHPEAYTGEITVTGEAPLVDVVSSETSSYFDADFVEDLPTRGKWTDIIGQAPAATEPYEGRGNYIAMYGANATSMVWNIDGMNMSSMETGTIYWTLNEEVLAETQVMGIGAGAEYGSTLGNVINVVTKSGTNEFHGTLNFYFMNDDLVGTNHRYDDSETGVYHQLEYEDWRATLGGPIVKDKLWFFAAFKDYTWSQLGPGQGPIELTVPSWEEDYDLKLTAQISDGHRVNIRGGISEWLYAWAPAIGWDPATTQSGYYSDSWMFNFDYDGVLSDTTLASVRGGTWNVDNRYSHSLYGNDEPRREDRTVVPWLVSGQFWHTHSLQDRDQLDAEVSYFAADFLKGSHEFKFGVQYSAQETRRTVYQTEFYRTYMASWGAPVTAHWYVRPFMYGADAESLSAFVDDSWKISDRVTIDFGIRYDKITGRIADLPKLDWDSQPTDEIIPGIDAIDWTNIAPRLGIAWQPTDDGKTVVRATAGLYYDGPVSAAWYAPPPGREPYYWGVPWGTYVLNEAADPNDLLHPGIKTPKTELYSLTVERQLGQDWAAGAQFVIRRAKDTIGYYILDDANPIPYDYTDPYSGETFEVWYYENNQIPTVIKGNSTGPGAQGGDQPYHIDYEGLTLTLKKRFSDGWDMLASYTYQSSEGINTRPLNDYGQGGNGQGLPVYTGVSGADANAWINAKGKLTGDRPHLLRVHSNFSLPWKFMGSAVLNYQSGRAFPRLAYATPSAEDIAAGISFAGISFVSEQNNRMPSSLVLDLGLQRTFELGHDIGLTFGVQCLNANNEDAGQHLNSWGPIAPGEDFYFVQWWTPRRFMLRARLEF